MVNSERIKYLLEIADIPARYKNADFKGINKKQEALVSALREAYNSKRDFVLYGNIGTGKTHIACGMIRALVNKGVHAKYSTQFKILECYYRKNFTEFDKYIEADFLVIDEVGKNDLAEWQKIQLDELLSERYNQLRQTLIITNQTKEGLREILSDRVIDRLRDNNATAYILDGNSLRGKISAKSTQSNQARQQHKENAIEAKFEPNMAKKIDTDKLFRRIAT